MQERGLIMENHITENTSLREKTLRQRYNNGRNNLLSVVVLSTINLVLLVINSSSYFLFSASVPYLLVELGKFICGMYPAEYYAGEFENFTFLPQSVFWVMLAIAVVIILLYLLSYLFSKKGRVGWLIFALVIFALDTVAMFWFYQLEADIILDIAFHIWVLITLAMAIHAHGKLKKLPVEPEVPATEEDAQPELLEAPVADAFDSTILRKADLEVKARTLLSFEAMGHEIVYRRVKNVNELVINGNVYDEYVATVEMAHTLTAMIDGHVISVGFNGVASSFGMVDGEQIAKKRRLY